MRTPRLSYRENYLRDASFQYPEYIPCRIGIAWPIWNTYREKVERVVARHPLIFRGFKPGSIKYGEKPGILRSNETRYDAFGCLWAFPIRGLQGIVVKHPLENWDQFRDFELPDPDAGIPGESGGMTPWETIYERMEKAKEEGELVVAGMPHGFFFQRLYYLRGFHNLLMDFVRRPPEIYDLVEMLAEYNLELVERLLRFKGIDVFSFGDDLGCQDRMPVSPAVFREFIFPAYKKIFGRIRSAGIHIRLHSDGHVVEVLDQIIESGVTIVNVQDRVNGLDNIARMCRGRVCVDLDIDRQKLMPYGTPEQIRRHVKTAVEKIATKKGGLMFIADLYPPTPPENIEALCQAFEEYMWLN